MIDELILAISDKIASLLNLQNQQATQITNLNNKVNGLKIGGRNLILNSKQTLRTLDASNNVSHKILFKITSNIDDDLSFANEIVLSCLIRYNDIASAGSRWQRIGVEARIVLDNDSVHYPSAFFLQTAGSLRHLTGVIHFLGAYPRAGVSN